MARVKSGVSVVVGVLSAGWAMAGEGTPEPPVDLSTVAASASIRPLNLNDEPHEAKASLLLDQTHLVPGQTVRVGVHLDPDEGWHAYWKSPGETGESMTLDWEYPAGFTPGEVAFPVPVRFDDQGIVSFGYEKSVLLYTDIVIPDDFAPGTHTIAVDASWLVCESQCIKGEVSLRTEVSVADASEPTPWAPLFDHYASLHPAPLASVDTVAVESALSQSAIVPGDSFQAVFRVVATGDEPVSLDMEEGQGTWPAFTPISDATSMWVEPSEVKVAEDGSTLIVMTVESYELDELPTNAVIGGLLQLKVGDEYIATEITIPLPWVPAETATQVSTSPLFAMAGIALDGAAPVVDTTGEALSAAGNTEPAAALTLTERFNGWFTTLSTTMQTLVMLAGAFAGGMILNIMPCVLPVLALKLFGLVHHSGASARTQRRAGIAYTAGVLVSFLALAVGIVALQAATGAAGWGVQFQSPIYVVSLSTVVFLFGLSMFGVFEIPAIGGNAAANATARDGVSGDFMYGVFATLLATPCSAPLLAPAVTFAFSMPSAFVPVFFLAIGAGLAFPFLVIAFIPALFRILPKPGAWMETFKQAMGFALVGAAVWVAYPLPALIGSQAFVMFLAFLTVVGAAAWVFGRFAGVAESGSRQLGVGAISLGMIALGGFAFLTFEYDDTELCDDNSLAANLEFEEEVPWQAFSEERLASATVEGPVFIDFTADWCVTCKVNERVIINTEPVRQAMADCGIIPLKADWTRRDEVITDWLARYGRAGVPFYLFVPEGGGEAIPLPDLLTAGSLLDTFEKGC
ncbi:MAG: thiol:disulfide interchange protein/DsbC/DsbD-like thiol-disulfide interchange protein [Myxococcota bacterium]|jgi:thiol:disulfide interchange protein/DsbC/DsbD-like thiol-disulfide interchange protein